MKCSFEIPIPHIKELKEHQEYDFTLAHLWLSSELYRSSYEPGSVMDNGMYELGQPMTIKDLKRAASLARPSVIIAPDYPADVRRTQTEYKQSVTVFDCEVAAVVVGETIDEQVDCVKWYLDQSVEILCFPFRSPRLEVIQVVAEELRLKDGWVHLLGAKSLEEVLEVKKLIPSFNLSVDTSKPLKAAIYDKTISDDLRGLPRLDMQARLEAEIVEKCRFNMDRWREEVQR